MTPRTPAAIAAEGAPTSISSTDERSRWVTPRWFEVLRTQLGEADVGTQRWQALRRRLDESIVVGADEILPTRVQFGSLVTVFATEEAEEQSFQIVSDDEADISAGLLARSSPLAEALYGAQEGDEVDVELEGRDGCTYEVTSVRAPRT